MPSLASLLDECPFTVLLLGYKLGRGCRPVQAEAGGARGPAWSRFGELFLALLHLMLDPAACLLSLDIQVIPSHKHLPTSLSWTAAWFAASWALGGICGTP